MARFDPNETPAQAAQRQAAEATRDVLERAEEDHGLCTTASIVDGMIEGIRTYLEGKVGSEAAIRKIRNSVDAKARSAPVLRLVPRN